MSTHLQIAKHIFRFSIVRYDNLIWVIETKGNRGHVLLIGPNGKGRQISNEREMEVILTPAQLSISLIENPNIVSVFLSAPDGVKELPERDVREGYAQEIIKSLTVQ